MAILTEIRNRTLLVITVLGIALLGFIVSDYFANGGGQQGGPQTLGKAGSKDITNQEFEAKVQDRIEQYKQQTGNLTTPAGMTDQVREQVWNEFEEEAILVAPAKSLGIDVSPVELTDMFQGQNIHPAVIQNFTNPQTGQFDKSAVAQFRNQALEGDDENAARQWINFEQTLKKTKATSKYYNLISKGLYATKAQSEMALNEQNQKADILYTVKRYNTVSDADVSYDESDLETYYNEHKTDKSFYQENEERAIEYVAFQIVPTSEDTTIILNNINELKQKFSNTTEDTLFVQSYASKGAQIKYYTQRTYPIILEQLVKDASVGQVVGPVFDPLKGTYNIAKVTNIKTASDSVKASHILVRIQNNDTARAQAKIDSLKGLIETGIPFEIIAKQTSEDPGSKENGGDLGWFQEGQMIKPFNDAAFASKVGALTSVVSSAGVHLIKVTEKTDVLEKRLLAIIDKKVEPSSATIENAYNKASAFSINATAENFQEKANALGIKLATNIKEADKQVQGIGEARNIVKWIYESQEVGAVSEPFELDNRFIVANLSEITPKGVRSLEAVQDVVEAEVIKSKKAEKISKGITADITAASSSWSSSVDTAKGISFSSFAIPGLGNEFNVIGSVYGLENGQTSSPIQGEYGVYVVKMLNKTQSPVSNTSGHKNILESMYQRRVQQGAYEALKDVAGVEDARSKFY